MDRPQGGRLSSHRGPGPAAPAAPAAADGERRAASSPPSPGNPQRSHNVLVINSLIGFAFAEIARSRWAPSAPCTGLAAGGG